VTQPVVLIADDDQQLLDAYRRSLTARRPDWELIPVATGREAMRTMESRDVDVLVTDLSMPGVDGLDLLHWTAHYVPRIVRIVVSGVLDGRTLIETRALAQRHFVKPVPIDRLVDAIDAGLRGLAAKPPRG
jgi:DNA-binding NtrC family response regulator